MNPNDPLNPAPQQPMPQDQQAPEQPGQSQTPGSTTGPGGPPAPQGTQGVYNSPSLAATPYDTQAPPQPQVVSGVSPQYPPKKGLSKLVIIIIAGVVLLVVLAIIVVISSSGQKPKTTETNQPAADATQSQSLKPAQAIDLEQASNAISQDLSTLDDEKDFPATSLDDKTLGL